MTNESVIATLGGQLKEVADRIQSIALTNEVLRANNSSFDVQLEDFLLDEISHAQKLVLELTGLVAADAPAPAANGDDSVFGPGELNSIIGEKEVEHPEPTKKE